MLIIMSQVGSYILNPKDALIHILISDCCISNKVFDAFKILVKQKVESIYNNTK